MHLYTLNDLIGDVTIKPIGSYDLGRSAEYMSRRAYINYWLFCHTNFLEVTANNRLSHADFWRLDDIARRRIDLMMYWIEIIFGIRFIA